MNERIKAAIPQLRSDVVKANELAGNKNELEPESHKEVETIVGKWIDLDRLLVHIPEYEFYLAENISFADLDEEVKTEQENQELGDFTIFTVGILGLLRILHNDSNIGFNNELIAADNLNTIINKIKSAFTILKATQKTPLTITKGGIEWELEHLQDLARSQELLGNPQKFLDLVQEIQQKALNKIADLQTTENTADSTPYPKRIAGLYSVLAVAQAREGRNTGKHLKITTALLNQMRSNREDYNADRSVILAEWALYTAIRDNRYSLSIGRILNLGLSAIMIMNAKGIKGGIKHVMERYHAKAA